MIVIQDLVKKLVDAGIEPNEANIELKLLIENIAGFGLVDILTGKTLTQEMLEQVKEKVELRASTRMPIQYITGRADFMGEKFDVNPSVLIPRDETEFLVRKAIEIIKENSFKNVLDMCTGSGCIACMIAKNTDACVLGVDVSLDALNVAITNMEKLALYNKAVFRKSDIYSSIRQEEKFDVIVSNPPYVSPLFKTNIQKEVTFEPEIALYTQDVQGLEFYQKIISKAGEHLNRGGYILFELGVGQAKSVGQLLSDEGFDSIQVIKDLANIERVIFARLP